MQNDILNAHVAIVSHVPYTQQNDTCYVNPVECRILEIFTRCFKRATLVRPRVEYREGQKDWVRLPEHTDARELRGPQDKYGALLNNLGLAPRRLADLLSDVDIVYGRLPSYEGWHAVRIAKRMNKHTIVSLHGDWAEAYSAEWRIGLKRILRPFIVWRADRIFRETTAQCDALFAVGEKLLERYAQNRTDFCVFANFLVEQRDIEEFRDTCQSKPCRLLFVGNISPRKGVIFLLEAVRLLRQGGRDICLTLVGEGTLLAKLKTEVARTEMSNAVEFAGRVPFGPRLWEYYKSHDIFILPSVASEGRPKVIMEAMAKSCPVIATRIGSVSGMIEQNHNGLLIQPGSSREIVQAVEFLLDNPKKRIAIIQNGLQSASNNTYEKQMGIVRDALFSKFGHCFGTQISEQ
ncbi:glycosyltransferase family 4 protein [Candidatus Sumerlaeota bacterium]|nr:glycosyltransferase family 4 protein [Candidatus Sumerlaeota bacterium]